MRRRGSKGSRGILGAEAYEASLDREDALRRACAQRPARESQSVARARCTTCGQWPRWRQTAAGLFCVGDGGPGHPYTG
jgi:hypothetical protein